MLETAALKAAQPQEDYNLDSLISRVSSLENCVKSMNGSAVSTSPNFASSVNSDELNKELAKIKEEIKELKARPIQTKEVVIEKQVEVEAPKKQVEDNSTKFKKELEEVINNDNQIEIAEIAKPETSQEASKIVATDEKPMVNITRVWGTVIRKLRADKNIMLWIACQDAEPTMKGEKLVVFVMGDNEYNLLSKKENLQALQDIVNTQCSLTVEIRIKNQGSDPFDEDIEQAKTVLGNTDVID